MTEQTAMTMTDALNNLICWSDNDDFEYDLVKERSTYEIAERIAEAAQYIRRLEGENAALRREKEISGENEKDDKLVRLTSDIEEWEGKYNGLYKMYTDLNVAFADLRGENRVYQNLIDHLEKAQFKFDN